MDPVRLYSARANTYLRFVNSVLYPQGIRAYFLRASYLQSGLRVLDAGCGSGIVTFALRGALLKCGMVSESFHAFDLTPAMLHRLRETLDKKAITDVEVAQADVLRPEELPAGWTDYDLIVSASMFEYLPRNRLADGFRNLHSLLKDTGRLVLFITRKNWMTRTLIGCWWKANQYDREELEEALRKAGFGPLTFSRFPIQYRWLSLWGHIVEAEKVPLQSPTE
ncbi:class I SAM-dependent methyltransferase [Proteobacteria bacterium 005FR1]|nr:class I SAM-dependent methyltransferase [Proteobacteria bacterium 005FR1]